jgi:hypothetical protein
MSPWRVRRHCSTLLAALWFAVSSPTSAQSASDSRDYNMLVREALAEFDDGNFPESRALFLRAHELQPSARTLRGLGVAAFALREYEDATRKLEEALASTVKPLDGQLRQETQNLLERAYGFVGRYELGLSPLHALILVDGAETDLHHGDRLLLSIGRHTLEARAPGYESDRRTVDVAGGENTGLSFSATLLPPAPIVAPAPVVVVATPLEAARAATPVPAPIMASPRSDRPPLYKNPWLWAGVGTAVVIVVVAVSVAATRDRSSIAAVDPTSNSLGVIEVN